VEVVEAAPVALARDAGIPVGRKEEPFGCHGLEGQSLGLRGRDALFGFGGLFEQLSALLWGFEAVNRGASQGL
jgi:hypothetical protein